MIAGVRPGRSRITETLRCLMAVVLLASVLALSGIVANVADSVLAALPNQPGNLSPVDNATGVSLNPTLEGSAFLDSDNNTHVASQWQITDNTSTTVFDSGTDNVSLVSIAVPSGLLSDNANYYWHVRYYDSGEEWSEWSTETSFETGNHAPDQPVNDSPADGAEEVSLNPELLSSGFSDPDEGDTHAASQWQITDNTSTTVFDSGTDNVSRVSIAIAPGILSDNFTYYWQVRHQDTHGAWSEWSAQTSFTTLNHDPNQPTNALPVDATEGTSLNPTLKSSPFGDPDFGDTHISSQWRIATVQGDYSPALFDSGTDNASLTEMVLFPGILEEQVVYYWQVRHRDNHEVWSAWSAETSFKTGQNRAPAQPTAVSPATGAADNITIPITLESSAFSDPDENDTHSGSRWQITKTTGDYSDALSDRIELKNGGLTSITIDLGVLSPGMTYFWRVQHRDIHESWSAWSAESSFTPVNRPPAKPSGLLPASGATTVSLTPTLDADFSDPDGSQDHHVSEWQLSTVQGNYDATVYSGTSETTSITVPEGVLSISTTYYWRVHQQDAQGEWSEWSDEASFTTRPALPAVDEGGGIPFWVWIIVGVAVVAIVGGVIIWRLRAAQ